MDSGLFQWFLCGCYLVGGISIGYWFNEWRQRRKGDRTGTGRWDYRKRPDTEDGGYFK